MTETRREAIKYELIPPVHNQLELVVEGVLWRKSEDLTTLRPLLDFPENWPVPPITDSLVRHLRLDRLALSLDLELSMEAGRCRWNWPE